MATGKTNARWMRVLVDEFNMSGDTREIGEVGVEYTEDDATALSDGVMNYTFGHPTAVMDGYTALFRADGSGQSFDVLQTPEERVISVAIGIRSEPEVGDPAFMHVANQASFRIDGSGPILASANMPRGISNIGMERLWGHVLAAGSSIGATTSYDSVDNGASTDNGLTAFLHVTATSSGDWVLKVQHSADDSTWADLITFSADGSAITSEVGEASGTVNRYLRFQATRTSGTTTFWVTAVRQ